MRIQVLAAAVAFCLVLLCGCAVGPRLPAPVPPVAVAQPGAASTAPAPPVAKVFGADFEREQVALANEAESHGRLAEAELSFEVLALLRPEVPFYAQQLQRLRSKIDAAVAVHMARGAAARQRGEWMQASREFLQVLAVSPRNTGAAQALREVERERNRRRFVGKFGRNVLTPRSVGEGDMQ